MPKYDDRFVPETVFAIRRDGRWHIDHRRCTAAELPAALAMEGTGTHEMRVLREGRVNPECFGTRTSWFALRLGWVKHPDADNWYPMEAPMPWLAGQPQRASVAFVLGSIAHGKIGFDVATTSQTIGCDIEAIDDSLVMFVRFARLIRDGGYPQAALVSRPRTFFVVQAMPGEPEHVRLLVAQERDDGDHRIDIHLPRHALLDALRTFFTCLAHDPAFGHAFVCYIDRFGEEDEAIDEQIDAEWRAAVEAGIVDPDDFDAEYRFHGIRKAERCTLSPPQAKDAEAHRHMLRTLEIPTCWLLHPHRFL